MKAVIFILFFVVAFAYLCERGEMRPKRSKAWLIILWPVLVAIAAFRSPLMPDYENYELFFHFGNARFETGFVTVTEWIKALGGGLHFFLAFFAGVSIALKFTAIDKMTKLVLGSLLVYISNIYILHDLIQMRCAIASGLMLLAVYFSVEKKWVWFAICFVVAFLFHYSALAFVLILFLNTQKPRKLLFAGLIAVSYALALAGTTFGSLVGLLPLEFVQDALAMYQDNIYEEINIFNALQLLRVALCFYLLYFIDTISRHNRFAVLLVKIYAVSLSCLVLFSDLPVLAFRISELLLVVEFIIVPMMYYTVKGTEIVRKLPVVAVSAVILILNVTKAALLV